MKNFNKISILNKPIKLMIELLNTRAGKFTLIIVLFTIYFSPYLINGQDSYIIPHDNLDQCNMIGIYDGTFKGVFFLSEGMEEYNLPGIQSIFRIVRLSLDKLLFHTFGYFWGFVINEILYRILAFIGMFLLIKRIKGNHQFPAFLLILLAFSFASLPFWPQGNASVAGIPLLGVVFHNLHIKQHYISSFLFIIFFGFYSSLILSGIFIGIIIIISFSILLMRGYLKWPLFFGALSLLVCWVISHYGLFWHQFVEQIPNSRSEYIEFTGGLERFIKETIRMFINGQYHAHSMHRFIILPSILVISFIYFNRFQFKKWIIGSWLYLIFSAIFFGLWFFTPVHEYYVSFNFGFNWSRFFFINPPVWYILWGLSLIYLYNMPREKNIKIFIVSMLLMLLIGYKARNFIFINVKIWYVVWGVILFYYFIVNRSKKGFTFIITLLLLLQISLNFNEYTIKVFRNKPTFRDYFSEQQFDNIEKILDLDKEELRVGCIGFYPSVANYNGFKTLGAYIGIYPLEFKRQFYRVIKGELDQNQILEKYYLEHGFRVYLFDDKIGERYSDQNDIRNNIPQITCELDIEEMKNMGVTHIFSTSEIINSQEKSIRLIYTSNDPQFYYLFYVYKVL